ncbi:MAG: hypothetical protein WCN89_01895, partial [bacterium]
GQVGGRGLEKGQTLAKILKPIKLLRGTKVRTEGGPLIEEVIIEAAIQHFDKTGNWPTSADSKSKIPLLPLDNWTAINSAGQTGYRSLEKGRTLAEILKPIKELKAKG